MSWPLPGELTDDALEHKLFSRNGVKQGTRRRTEPNWPDLAAPGFGQFSTGGLREWRLARVSTDYHVEFKTFFYSVPHSLIRQQVDLRATARTIEIFHRGKRVAVHQRRYGGPRHGTDPDHMPSSHRRYAEWTPERFRRWATSIGPQTEGLVIAILASRPHPEQGFRTCLGILRLFRDIDRNRAEAVSARAVEIGGLNCKRIASLIANHKAACHSTEPTAIVHHANLRGPDYFH